MVDAARTLLNFLAFSERLKRELRHSWLSDGRRESVAEHSWQMALMAMLTFEHLDHPVDRQRVLEMILVHDLVEAEAGDVPAFQTGPRRDAKAERERRAIERIRDALDPDTGRHLFALFLEFETGGTSEARLVQALDRLEVQVQHNLADLATWEEVEYGLVYTRMDAVCAHDGFLRRLCRAVRDDAEAKMRAAGVEVAGLRDAARVSFPASRRA